MGILGHFRRAFPFELLYEKEEKEKNASTGVLVTIFTSENGYREMPTKIEIGTMGKQIF